VVGLLREPGVRLLTLTGPAGVGKTRLALRAAAELPGAFPDGVWVVALGPVADAALVLPTVARALGLPEQPGAPPSEALRRRLGRRRALLVLDNLEHLLPAAPALAELLDACPRLAVLATSREPLHLSGEREFPVAPLPVPAARPVPGAADLASNEAVALFAERARSVRPDFALTDGNAAAVAEVCRRLDGLPLAIELAAARLRALSPGALLVHLERRLPLLAGGPRDAPARHRTLRDALAWSYALLSAGEQALLAPLGVFAGGLTPAAAAAVAGEPADREREDAVLDGLLALADKSLVRPDAARDGGARFALLETVREFALERLQEAGEADRVRRRHAGYFLGLAEAAEPHLRGTDQVVWLDRLEAERDNLREALRWAVERGRAGDAEAARLGLRLAAAAWWLWWLRGPRSEGHRWLTAVLALPGPPSPGTAGAAGAGGLPGRARAAALLGAACLTPEAHDPAAARRRRTLLEQSLSLFQELRDREGAARTLKVLSAYAFDEDDADGALAHATQALDLARAAGDPWCLANALNQLGAVRAWGLGDLPGARALCEEALALARRLDDPCTTAWCASGLARVLRALGQRAAARPLLQESVALLRRVGHRRDLVPRLLWLAQVEWEDDRLGDARALLEQGVATARDVADPALLAFALSTAGQQAQLAFDFEAARAALGEALPLYRALGNAQDTAVCRGFLGAVAWRAGQLGPARALLEESLAEVRSATPAGAPARARQLRVLLWCHYILGRVAHDAGDPAAARARYREAVRILAGLADTGQASMLLRAVARLEAETGAPTRAARLLAASSAGEAAGGVARPPAAQADYDQAMRAVRAALSAEAVGPVWAEGAAIALEQAIALALECVGVTPPPPRPAAAPSGAAATDAGAARNGPVAPGDVAGAPPRPRLARTRRRAEAPAARPAVDAAARPPSALRPPVVLTPRELEVLALVTAGRSNQEIAAELVLSARTVERHLARIYGRLGIGAAAPRVAAAAYAVAHGLAAPPAAGGRPGPGGVE
jgi:predicted ATPase/DNA-binding CsgD family transcriptional regulator